MTDTAETTEVPPPADPSTGELVPAAAPAAAPVVFPTDAPRAMGGLPYASAYMKLAVSIQATEMVPKDLQERPDAILAIFLRGFEMGMGPMQSLDSFHVIQGKVGLKAEAMRAQILEAGHKFIIEEVEDADGTVIACQVECRRLDWPADRWRTYRYSLDDARLDALVEWHERWVSTSTGKRYKETWNPHGPNAQPEWVTDATLKRGDNWLTKPRSMLDARCTSGAARRWFADVLAGMSYTPEEVAEFDGAQADASIPSSSSAAPAGGSGFHNGDGGADSPANGASDAPPPAPAPAAPAAKKASASTKKAQSRAAGANKKAPAGGSEQEGNEVQRDPHLPNGELRVTQTMVNQLQAQFQKLNKDHPRDWRINYLRTFFEDSGIETTWDLSVTEGQKLFDHLRQANGDAPPPSDGDAP